MTHWLFDAGAETWGTTAGFTWDAASQSMTAVAYDGNTPSTDITGLSEVVAPGDPFGFRLRLVLANPLADPGFVGFSMALSDGLGLITDTINITTFPYDNIFSYYSGTVDSAGTVTSLDFGIAWTSVQELTVYLDEVYLNELPPSGSPDARYLGLTADFGHIYLTSITGGTLSYYSVPLGGTVTPTADGSATFGTAGYTDPDTFTRGLYPVVRPGADGMVYLRGRDATNRQVLQNDLSGTAGWVDAGPGTVWGTAKYCTALLPSQLEPEDMIAAFYDNDIYHVKTYGADGGTAPTGGTIWAKEGDNPTSIRTAARHPTTPESLYLAGTTTGTVNMSVALGAGAFVSIGGTVVTGTINAIEVSW